MPIPGAILVVTSGRGERTQWVVRAVACFGCWRVVLGAVLWFGREGCVGEVGEVHVVDPVPVISQAQAKPKP